MKCEYCFSENKKDNKICDKCGAPLPKTNKLEWKSEPFFYNGYICYTLRDFSTDIYECQFWLGMELIERIKINRIILEEHVPEMYDPMSFVWELFLVAHGEKEVFEFQEKNNKYPATFQVTRIENKEKEEWRNMGLREILQAFR